MFTAEKIQLNIKILQINSNQKKQQMIVLHPIMFMKRLRTMWRPDLMLTVIDLYVHFIRGGDYQSYTYKPDSIVVDNPPFSILAQIVKWYQSQGIKFFLFAPGLTIIGLTRHANIICVGYTATYENGAKVNTSFVTNMTDNLIESSSKLYKRLENADKENLRKIKKQLPKYTYPDNILTACRMNTLSRYGVDFAIKRENGHFMRDLDSQRKFKKGIFGCGYLISGKKAAELKAAELKAAENVWELSEREKEIIKTLK